MPTAPESAAGSSRPLAAALAALLTVIALLYIAARVDWTQLAPGELQIDWISLCAGIFVIVGYCLVSALRWKVLFGGRLDYRAACLAVFIALGLNAILPARGGDIVRLLYLRNALGIALPASVLRLLVEKSLDLACVVLLTLLSGAVLSGGMRPGLPLAGAVVCALGLLAVAAASRPDRAGTLVARLQAAARLPPELAQRQQELLREFLGLFHSRLLAPAAALSALNWFVLQFVFVTLVARSLHIGLDYPAALLVIGFGALSLGLPAAPAGIGVYHAAVMGAMELLGYPAERALVFATLLHLANTLPVIALAGACHGAAGLSRRPRAGHDA